MRFLSICSGIEAASVAWNPLGWEAVGFSEIEKFPCAVLAHHYPEVPNLGDMTEFEAWPDMNIDLLCGGTPCQAFSVAGKREGLKDDRGNLTLTFCGIADRYNPDWIMWENVPGVLSSKDNAFGCFLAELCGADAPLQPVGGRWPNAGVVAGSKRTAAWRVLDAQYVRVDGYAGAVPQRRRRVFVVACAGTTGDPATVLFEPEGLCRNTPPRRETREGTAPDVGKSLKTCSGGIDREAGHTLIPDVSQPLTGVPYADRGASAENKLIPDVGHRMVAFGEYVEDETASAMKARDYKDATDLVSCVATHDKATRHKSKSKDRANDDGAGNGLGVSETGEMYTLTSGDKHAVCCAPVAPCMTSGGAPFERTGNERTGNERTECDAIVAVHGTQDPDVNEDLAHPLGRNTGQENAVLLINTHMQVRRLTPRECERLQGFPDDYTQIPWRKKAMGDCPDGPRYKALGNSWAVNCARWIGRRIEWVESEKTKNGE